MPASAPAITVQHLPYVDRLGRRAVEDIDLVVIHCTELPDMAMAREYGERILYPEAGTGAAGHWYVDRDGSITEYVPAERIAHHVRGWNPRSVGIELVNAGRYPHWYDSRHQAMTEPYPQIQVDALVALLRHLGDALPGLLGSASRVAVIHPGDLQPLAERLAADVDVEVLSIVVPDAEAAKTVEVLQQCWHALAAAGFTRNDVIIGMGGGTATDLAGFVAATWLRGVDFISIPTTVLAMVDLILLTRDLSFSCTSRIEGSDCIVT